MSLAGVHAGWPGAVPPGGAWPGAAQPLDWDSDPDALFLHDFIGADGTNVTTLTPQTGSAWTQSGTWTAPFLIKDGKLQIPLGSIGSIYTDLGETDYLIRCSVPIGAVSQDNPSIYQFGFRYQDDDNRWCVQIQPGNADTMQIFEVVGGSSTVRATLSGSGINLPHATVGTVLISVRGDTVTVTLGGGWSGTLGYAGMTTFLDKTKVGILARDTNSDGQHFIDNFFVIPPGLATIKRWFATGAWSLSEDSNTRYDSIGEADLGGPSVPATALGLFGKTADFARSSAHYLTVTDAVAPQLATGDIDFSIRVAFKPESLPGQMVIAARWDSGSGQREWLLRLSDSSKLQLLLSSSGSGADVTAEFDQVLVAGTQYVAHVSHSAALNRVGLSLNGQTITNTSYSSGVYDGAATFNIGTAGFTGAEFDGLIEDFLFIKNYAWTQEDVDDDYDGGTVRPFEVWDPEYTTISDDFERANSSTLGESAEGWEWETVSGIVNFGIDFGTAKAGSGDNAWSAGNVAGRRLASANQYVEGTGYVWGFSGGPIAALALRWGRNTQARYVAGGREDGNTWIWKVDSSGGGTQIANVGVGWALDDVMRFEAENVGGSVELRVYKNGSTTPTLTYTDSSSPYLSFRGVGLSGKSDGAFSDFEAGALSVEETSAGSGNVTGVGALSGAGYTERAGAGSASGIGRLQGTGYIERAGSGNVTGIAALAGVGYAEPVGSVSLISGGLISGGLVDGGLIS